MVKPLLISLVKGYRFFLSPWLGSACRFEPSCSRYALEALQLHGAAAGSYLVARRLLRCQRRMHVEGRLVLGLTPVRLEHRSQGHRAGGVGLVHGRLVAVC